MTPSLRGAPDLCRVLVPPYWTSVTSVAFSFTPFADNTSGIRSYEWGLGSQSGQDDVIPFRFFTGTTMVILSSASVLSNYNFT